MKTGELIALPDYGTIKTYRILEVLKTIVIVESPSGVKSWKHRETVELYNCQNED